MTSWSSKSASSSDGSESAGELVPRQREENGRTAGPLGRASFVGVAALVVGAPVAVGGVHRASMSLLCAGAAAALGLVVSSSLAAAGRLRIGGGVVLPLVFLAVAVLQSLPLPAAVVGALDPSGRDLIAGSPLADAAFRPLSLDPTSTRIEVGKAGAALALFLAVFHMACRRGRQRWRTTLKVVALAGVATWVIGIGHRFLGFDLIYGRFQAGTGLLLGPFVNPNHAAEILELGAFVALACAATCESKLARVGWIAAAIMGAAAALSTLSRGAVLALGAGGGFLLAIWWRQTPAEERRVRRAAFAAITCVVVVAIVAGVLGASALIDDVARTSLREEAKFQVWGESLRLIKAHPAGIGRGVFDRIFPAYRDTGGPVRMVFAENQPVQLLVEMGWAGFLGLVLTVGFVVRQVVRHGRHDAVEAALLAGLAAVLVHNFVDFGLETLGIILPFCAVLAVMLARSRDASERILPAHSAYAVVASALLAACFGIAALASPSPAELDAALRAAPSKSAYREIAARASAAHPTDYFYALAAALSEPIAPDASGRSPRLRALNRALRLCGGCAEVHRETARALWALGKRSQAMEEWRAAVRLSPAMLLGAFEDAHRAGATATEMAALTDLPEGMLELAHYLSAYFGFGEARALVGRARAAGAPPLRALLVEAEFDLRSGDLAAARTLLSRAQALAPADARAFLMRADVEIKAGADDRALAILETGTGVAPGDVGLQRRRIEVIMRRQRWQDADRALEGLRSAIGRSGLATTEAHVAAARVYAQQGGSTRAIGEYRIALTKEPESAGIWRELGGVAEQAGRLATALEAYRHVVRLLPKDAQGAADLARVEAKRREP